MSPSHASVNHKLSPEEQLLLLCARTRVSPEIAHQISAVVNDGLNWALVVQGAENHGILPLICYQLFRVCPKSLPPEWSSALRQKFEETAQRNLFMTVEMVRLCGRLQTEGLTAVPYKGPVLAVQAYGNLALRQFADLDFAIRQRDLPRAQALLLADGYQTAFGKVSSDEGSRPTHSEYQFVRPAGNMIVELQTETTLRYFPLPLDLDALSSRARLLALAGTEVPAFSVEDTLILLAVHGAKHFWERLLWIADIAELVQIPNGLNWTELFARAKGMQVERLVRLALYVAHHMLDAPLPDEVLHEVQGDARARKLGEGIRARFSLDGNEDLPVFGRFRFRVATRDSLWQGLRHALQLATSPTEPDRADVPLPGYLSGAHAWLRPWLLMRRYGIRRRKSEIPPPK